MYGFKLSILYSLNFLSSFKLIVPLEAASNFVMAARLELFITSTMVRLARGDDDDDEVPLGLADDDDENELDTLVVFVEVA